MFAMFLCLRVCGVQALMTVTVLWFLLFILDVVKHVDGQRANFALTMGLRFATLAVAIVMGALCIFKFQSTRLQVPYRL